MESFWDLIVWVMAVGVIVYVRPILAVITVVPKVVRFIWEFIGRRYLQPIYDRLHASAMRRHDRGLSWLPLGDLLEVSLETVNMFTKEYGREPYIVLRTRSTVPHPVDMAMLLVRTQGLDGRLQETVIFHKVGHNAERIKLVNMPLEDLLVLEDRIVEKIRKISVELLEISYEGAPYQLGWPKDIELHGPTRALTYFYHLNGGWVRKWGEPYNLRLYFSAQKDFEIAIRYVLKYGLLPSYGGDNLRQALVRLLTSKPVLKPLFFLLVPTRCVHISDDGRLCNNMKLIRVPKIRKWLGLRDSVYSTTRRDRP